MDISQVQQKIPEIVLIIALIAGGVYLANKKPDRWMVYQKQYKLISLLIIITSSLYLFSVIDNNGVVTSILTGLIASILYGVANLETDYKFAEKISQQVAGTLDGTRPFKVYPPVKDEKNAGPEFRIDLIDAMYNSNSYCYSGVDMTVASHCIQEALKKAEYGEKKVIIKDMLFIIPDLNAKDIENNNPIIDKKIKKRKEDSRKKLVKSIETISMSCSQAHYKITAHFYVFPQRPTLHIHKTEEISFLGVVDKVESYDCPTTYCYKKCDTQNDKKSMYITISEIIQQAKNRVEDNFIPGKHFEITWYKEDMEKNDIITYKDHSNGSHVNFDAENFVKAMSFE